VTRFGPNVTQFVPLYIAFTQIFPHSLPKVKKLCPNFTRTLTYVFLNPFHQKPSPFLLQFNKPIPKPPSTPTTPKISLKTLTYPLTLNMVDTRKKGKAPQTKKIQNHSQTQTTGQTHSPTGHTTFHRPLFPRHPGLRPVQRDKKLSGYTR